MNAPLHRLAGGAKALRSAFGLLGAAWLLSGCATPPAAGPAPSATALAGADAKSAYGIQIEGLHLTAAGSMLDFRYRVSDARKAAPILDGKMKPYLLDEVRGAKLDVPDTPVLGRIRQTARNGKILADRTYFIMFGNPGKALRSGDKVTLLLGEVKITDLTVE
jgi:hypothetical protein